MTTRIPTSTSITEGAVISAPLSQVWHLIKLQDFHVFWSKLKKSEHVKGASPETDVVKWTFADGTEQEVKQEEHSVCGHPTTTPRIMHSLLQDYDIVQYAVWVWDEWLMILLTGGIQAIDHFITYSVISSSPALTYSSVISTIRCYAVTTGEKEGSTFVQWSAHFSSDADAGSSSFPYFHRAFPLLFFWECGG